MANYKIEEIGAEIHVYVTVPFSPTTRTYQGEKVYSNDVQDYLEHAGLKYGEMLQKDTAHNKNGKSGSGHWIFKKLLDNSSKQVILKVEKPVQPKPKTTRKKRTRSSTKKVSTEE